MQQWQTNTWQRFTGRLWVLLRVEFLAKIKAMDGCLLKSVGGRGNQPGQFKWPNGITCSKEGEIYVCNTMNSRIQVFDKDEI
jgi:hypothetical protein